MLLALPYFFFHTQLWPKSISSSLLIIGIIQLFEYFNSKNKFQLVISSLIFGMISNGINEKIAYKIAGKNWLNFMESHF